MDLPILYRKKVLDIVCLMKKGDGAMKKRHDNKQHLPRVPDPSGHARLLGEILKINAGMTAKRQT